VDLAGHGDGPRLPAEHGDLTALVDAVVPRLPAGLTVLVGHSLGAVVALAVAARRARRGPGPRARGASRDGRRRRQSQVADSIEAGALAVRADRQAFWGYVRLRPTPAGPTPTSRDPWPGFRSRPTPRR
jgi:pimeloyl-ACP methyl ester carboxylesterase